MILDPNSLYYIIMAKLSTFIKKKKRLTVCSEGGTRSGKTFDNFDVITTICDHNRSKGLDIYIIRDTLVRCRDYTFKDWKKLNKINKIQVTGRESPKPDFQLFGNNVYFRGLDDPDSEGYPSDILFFNEVLEMNKPQVDDLVMRCRMLVLFDWNPKLTKHWIFEYEGRKDVLWTNSTYLNNKHLEQSIIDEIESYNPEIEANVINKTANLFRWKVYGLGVRADQEGNVFNDSELNKFDIEDVADYIDNGVKISWTDVADQGIDKLCKVDGLLIDEKVYVIDVIFSGKGSAYTCPLIIEQIKRNNLSRAMFESNNQGLMFTKLIKKTLLHMPGYEKYIKIIDAIPNTKNKHSRIVIQAETNIIKNFYFLRKRAPMYADYYDNLTNYKHDKSVKQDDAPDATAGLSVLAQTYQ